MSETGSSFKSACSVYSLPTNINRPHIVSYQERFNQLNPEVEIQHALENSSAVGQSGSVTSDQCCHHHDTMREAVNNNHDQNISVLRTAHLPSEIFACVYQNPELRTYCNCNVHSQNNLGFIPTITTQCCVDRIVCDV